DERREEQPRLAVARLPESARRALEAAVHGGRHADLRHRPVDRVGRLAERHAEYQVERDRRGDELALMVDGERRRGGLVARDRGERHLAARGRENVDVRERFGALPVLWRDLHHYVVLVERGIARRYLRLAERAV